VGRRLKIQDWTSRLEQDLDPGRGVDSLPELFLAYCTLADSDDIMSDDDRAVPRGSDSDPVPLLTGCALGLSPTFLSRSRR
jgi:hypothetical protein